MIGIFVVIILMIISLTFLLYEYKIDIVYTWVDTYDPERDIYMQSLEKTDGNAESVRYDQHDELKFSLRSVEKYCKWVNKIYVVVKDGQKPPFINSKIILVNHSSIMPKSALPTFNSVAIELCICNIPGLSDRYLYFNDDIFVNKPLDKNSLFCFGLPKVNIKRFNKPQNKIYKSNVYNWETLFYNGVAHANLIFKRNMSILQPHTPSICYKPWEKEMENILQEYDNNIWSRTVNSKFRQNDTITINNCFRTVFYTEKGSDEIEWKDGYINVEGTCNMHINPVYDFYCINKITDNCTDVYTKTLLSIFPDKCSFEI